MDILELVEVHVQVVFVVLFLLAGGEDLGFEELDGVPEGLLGGGGGEGREEEGGLVGGEEQGAEGVADALEEFGF